jgi:hypothetical protein
MILAGLEHFHGETVLGRFERELAKNPVLHLRPMVDNFELRPVGDGALRFRETATERLQFVIPIPRRARAFGSSFDAIDLFRFLCRGGSDIRLLRELRRLIVQVRQIL